MTNMHPRLIDCRGVKNEEQPWGSADTLSTLICRCMCPGTVIDCESKEDEKKK